MKPPSRTDVRRLDLSQVQFDQILNLDHPLVVLVEQIDWSRFDEVLEQRFPPEVGAPALRSRAAAPAS